MDRPLEAQLRATLNVIPVYKWYAAPSGALTFGNERCADYLGLSAGGIADQRGLTASTNLGDI